MASRFERLSSPSSQDPSHTLPSSTSFPITHLPTHPQPRPPVPRSSPTNPHRSSNLPSLAHSHKLGHIPPQPGLDLSLNMLVHPPRHHSPFSLPPQGLPGRGQTGSRLSMQPSQSHPSFQTFAHLDQRRETLHLPSSQFAQRSNRQSRHMDLPVRRNNEPANLILSVRGTPPASRPNSVHVDARRVVTGVLQSALPPSSRPAPINTAPVRSMSIAELESRHKAALQKLQTHSNQHVINPSVAKSSTTKPPTTKLPSGAQSYNLERHHRHKAAMRKLQANSTPPVVVNPQASSHRQSLKPPPKAVAKPKPSRSVSDSSSKFAKVDEPIKSTEKPSGFNSSRRSLFGFWTLKEPSKSAAASPGEPQAKPKSPKTSKKQREEGFKSVDGKLDEENQEEDEDVPLAQLVNRRSCHNPTALDQASSSDSHLSKSFSVPGTMHKMGSHPLSSDAGARSLDRPQNPRCLTNPLDNRPSRRSSRQRDSVEGFQAIHEDNKPVVANATISARLDLPFRPPPWLDAGLESFDGEKQGPRPLIFEDEAKAIRNSRRLWT